jgi:hypothetical protein
MATKVDKEAIKKNLFWILLGVFGAFWLITVVIIYFSSSDAKEREWKKAKADVEKALKSGVKTDAYITPWNSQQTELQKHKDVLWKEGWSIQEGLYTWPEEMKVKPLYPEDPLGPDGAESANNRGTYASTWYKSQFELTDGIPLSALAAPAEFRGGFDAVFPKQVFNANRPPTREEIWLAQEDFWVRREMLLIIQEALNASALFKEVTKDVIGDKDAKLPPGILKRRVFRSAFWELDLLLAKDTKGPWWVISPDSTIKNVNRTQKIQSLASSRSQRGVPFRLVQGSPPNQATHVIRIAGEPLAYDASTKLQRAYMVDPVDLQKPFEVQQVLEQEVSPIREVVALEAPMHSHRTISWGYKSNAALKKLDAPKGPEPPPGVTPPDGKGMPEMPGPEDTLEDQTPINQINRLRYMQVTPQCRHLPIAMRLVVDQSHLNDILAAVSNSPLRIQVTQVTLNHSPPTPTHSTPPPGFMTGGPPGMIGGGPPTSSFVPPPATIGGGRGGRLGRLGGMTGLPPRGPGGQPPREVGDDVYGAEPGKDGKGSKAGGKVLDSAQLVDVCIYGVAILYERFPPRPGSAKKP